MVNFISASCGTLNNGHPRLRRAEETDRKEIWRGDFECENQGAPLIFGLQRRKLKVKWKWGEESAQEA